MIQFYDVCHRCKVGVPLEQVKKALYKRTARTGKVQVHYILITRLNGTVLRKLVRRQDWLELDVPKCESPRIAQILPPHACYLFDIYIGYYLT